MGNICSQPVQHEHVDVKLVEFSAGGQHSVRNRNKRQFQCPDLSGSKYTGHDQHPKRLQRVVYGALRTSCATPSMGSGHPCALSNSIGISLIGGGAAGGLSRVDEACLLAQMGQGQAALIMIARRDSEACFALRQVGTIPAGSVCSASDRRSTVQARRTTVSTMNQQATTRTTPAPISRYVSCSKRSDGKILARKQMGAPYTNEQVAAYCRSQIN